MTVALALWIVVAMGVGGLVKGISGTGGPIVAVPLLALGTDLKTAVVVTTVPGLVGNVVSWSSARREPAPAGVAPVDLGLGPMLASGIPAAIIGALALDAVDPVWVVVAVEVMVAAYVAARLVGPLRTRRIDHPPLPLEMTVGAIGGFSQGLIGASGPVIGTWFLARGVGRRDFLIATSSLYAAAGAVQLVTITAVGLLTPERLAGTLLGSVVMLVAVRVGLAVSATFDAVVFERLATAGLVLGAVLLAVRAL